MVEPQVVEPQVVEPQVREALRVLVLTLLALAVGVEFGVIGHWEWLRRKTTAPVLLPEHVVDGGKAFPTEAWLTPKLSGGRSFVETIVSSTAMVIAYTPGNLAGESWMGTGVVIGPNLLLTANHVIEGATAVSVSPCRYETGENPLVCEGALPAEIIAQSEDSDLALIRLNATPAQKLVPVEIGDTATLAPGQWLWRVGMDGVRVACGSLLVFSADAFEISAPGHPGSSGGPVFDRLGRVVGIMTSYGPDMLSARGKLLSAAVKKEFISKYAPAIR